MERKSDPRGRSQENMMGNLGKKVVLIAGSRNTMETLCKQIRELIPEVGVLEGYASEERIPSEVECDLLVISSQRMEEDLRKMDILFRYTNKVICQRNIHFDRIDQVAAIEPGTCVLLVNDEKETAEAAIQNLLELGLNHIQYKAYYPGIKKYTPLCVAVTPGEADKVPSCAHTIIDIGARVLDVHTLYTITDLLQIDNKAIRFFTEQYMHKIIQVSQNMIAINQKVNQLNNHLNQVVSSLGKGMMVLDEEGYVSYINQEMRKILLLESKTVENKNIKQWMDKALIPWFLSKSTYEEEPILLLGKMVRITKFWIPESKSIVITIGLESGSLIQREYSQGLLLKGHVAKYDLGDIQGDSLLIRQVKEAVLKLAKTELTVLLEGESGTGKELFASAIHNHSKRSQGPFLAVNFSALPDELMESELFGYEEGAFTGARKGGKVGLFELAEGGTLFLDEIGDISPKMQTRLLRVLQEKEILAVGGSIIKKLDVRIVVATNKDLHHMVQQKQFRADLYYRLKIGYIHLPPLRKRPEDIQKLAEYFVRKETAASVQISSDVFEAFRQYPWTGNIRELENTIQYMLAVRKSDEITGADLPDAGFFQEKSSFQEQKQGEICFSQELPRDYKELLLGILHLSNWNKVVGRAALVQEMEKAGRPWTPSQIRTKLEFLAEKGYVLQKKGRFGTVLTEKAMELLDREENKR